MVANGTENTAQCNVDFKNYLMYHHQHTHVSRLLCAKKRGTEIRTLRDADINCCSASALQPLGIYPEKFPVLSIFLSLPL